MKVKIIDHTENPIETIYKAYRICYSKDVPTEIKIPMTNNPLTSAYGTDIPDTQKMLEFINKHSNHESPLEHASFTFAIEGVSRITEQQLTRHRIGASYSIQSGRYVNKSSSNIIVPKTIKNDEQALHIFLDTFEHIKNTYDSLVNLGIPKEDARFIMPQGQGTNIIVTMNVRELIHFFQERLCKHAQWEIRTMAEEMRKQTNEILPIFSIKSAMKCGKTCFECSKKGE